MNNDFQAWVPLKKSMAIASSVENIHQVESFIEDIHNDLDFREDVYGNVMVAVTEAVNNSIIHGNKSDSGLRVYVTCEQVKPFVLMVVVEDEGSGFNPEQLKDPTAPENIENPGGRGVFLMRHLADELRFGNQGRRVEMTFNI